MESNQKIIQSKGRDEKNKIPSEKIFPTISSYKFSSSTFFIAYLDYKVVIGKFSENQLIYYDKELKKEISLSPLDIPFLQKLRIFNNSEELYIWNSNRLNDEFSYRYRKDGEGETDIEYLPINQVLFGTRTISMDNTHYTLLREERGIEIILPKEISSLDKSEKIAIQVHYYIDFNDLGIAQYIDSRFVKFVKLNMKEQEEI